MGNEGKSLGVTKLVWNLAGLLVIVLAGLHIFLALQPSSVRFSTPYQAVILTNGSVYFGHLQVTAVLTPCLQTSTTSSVKAIRKRSRSPTRSSRGARSFTNPIACT